MHGQRPRLLICVGEFIEGAGQSRVVCEEVQHLSDRYEITIASNSIVWQSPIDAKLENLRETRGTLNATEHLRRIIKRSDLVHCHDSLAMMLIAATESKPWVVTSHGIAPIRLRSNPANRIKGAVTLVTYPLLYRRATKLVAISPYIQEWLVRHIRRTPILIPNGAPKVPTFAARHMPSNPTLLYVGEISHRKGITDLIRAAALLPHNATLTLVGRGDITEFQNASDSSGASIKPLGLVSDAQLHELYQHATCVVSASYWEGYGLPIVEGFANGAPALVRNNTNMRNLILDSKAGRFFNDVEQIPSLLNEIVAHWQHLSSNALVYARSHSWDRTFDQYDQLFESLL